VLAKNEGAIRLLGEVRIGAAMIRRGAPRALSLRGTVESDQRQYRHCLASCGRARISHHPDHDGNMSLDGARYSSFGSKWCCGGARPCAAAIARPKRSTADPSHYCCCTVQDPANPEIHFRTTVRDLGRYRRQVDVLVEGVGHRRHHQRRHALPQAGARQGPWCRWRERRGSGITQKRSGQPSSPPASHTGERRGHHPDTLDHSASTGWRLSPTKRPWRPPEASARGGHPHGSPAARRLAVAVRLAREPQFARKTIVTIPPIRRALPHRRVVRMDCGSSTVQQGKIARRTSPPWRGDA